MSNAPSKPVSFSRPKVGYFSNRPRINIHVPASLSRIIISGLLLGMVLQFVLVVSTIWLPYPLYLFLLIMVLLLLLLLLLLLFSKSWH